MAEASIMQEPPRGAGETVLVVDDDFEVRRLATILLRDLGCVVLDAEDGPSGLRLLAERPPRRLASPRAAARQAPSPPTPPRRTATSQSADHASPPPPVVKASGAG